MGIVTSINAGDGCAKPVGGLIPAPERLVHSVPDILFKVTIPPRTFLGIHFCLKHAQQLSFFITALVFGDLFQQAFY